MNVQQQAEQVLGEHRGGRAGTTCSCGQWSWQETGGGSHWEQHRAHIAAMLKAAGVLRDV